MSMRRVVLGLENRSGCECEVANVTPEKER